jgi:hypothetical protein
MIKPDTPDMTSIPGMGAMADSLDFVKNLWGSMGIPGMNTSGMNMPGVNTQGMNIPGMVMPTLSVEEINKKITDMKAVESWLALNMNMLRGTIQALEVQAATISTLQQMGETFTSTMASAATPSGSAATSGAGNGASAARSSSHEEQQPGAPEPSSNDEQNAAQMAAPLVNAAAWWSLLQDQFQQAVSNAMTAEVPAASSGSKPKAKPKPKTKTAASTTAPARKRKTSK